MSSREPCVRLTKQAVGQPLAIEIVARAGLNTLVFIGETDLAAATELETTIREACASDAAALVIDLRKVTFIDSTGCRALLLARKLCRVHRQELGIIPGPRNVQRVIEVSGLDQLLPFVDGGPAAVA